MFCKTCGKEVNKNAEYCLSCGVNPQLGNAYCYNCGVDTNPEQVVCVACGVNLEKNVSSSSNVNESTNMFCKGCGSKIHEKAEICTSCGIKPLNAHNFCQHCGSETTEEQEICTSCGVRVNSKVNKKETSRFKNTGTSYSSYPQYYQAEFSAIENSNEQYQGKFNWPSFLICPIWLVSKGLWQLALIVCATALLPFFGMILNILFCFLVGRKANYLYYRKEKYGEQFPKDWKIFLDFSNRN